MPHLYLIRHAQPDVLEYLNSYPGPDLGEAGKAQAQWIAQYLSTKQIQQIWASDYPRVLQTLTPFVEKYTDLKIQTDKALWEREPTLETHESLVQRVHSWFSMHETTIRAKTTAIFSHCDPINMILEYLDPHKTQLQYPYTSPHGCHTPCAGIWEIQLTQTGISGSLTQFPNP